MYVRAYMCWRVCLSVCVRMGVCVCVCVGLCVCVFVWEGGGVVYVWVQVFVRGACR